MQQALQIQTLVDQRIVNAIPALQPLLGHKVQMIALDLETSHSDESGSKISLDQFLSHRLKRPKDVPPVTLEDMDEAIRRGAVDGEL